MPNTVIFNNDFFGTFEMTAAVTSMLVVVPVALQLQEQATVDGTGVSTISTAVTFIPNPLAVGLYVRI